MNEKLKPCPFCGGVPKMEVLGGLGSTHRTISCTGCKCDLHWQPTEELAIRKWNIRVESGEQTPELRATQNALEGVLRGNTGLNAKEWAQEKVREELRKLGPPQPPKTGEHPVA